LIVGCDSTDSEDTLTPSPVSSTTLTPTPTPTDSLPTPPPLGATLKYPRDDNGRRYILHLEAVHQGGTLPAWRDVTVLLSKPSEESRFRGRYSNIQNNDVQIMQRNPFTWIFEIQQHEEHHVYWFSHYELDGVIVDSSDGTVTVAVDDENPERTLTVVYDYIYSDSLQPTPTPTLTPAPITPQPEGCTLQMRCVFLWEKGSSEFIATTRSPLSEALSEILNKLNKEIACEINDNGINEILENGNVIELKIRHGDSITIGQLVSQELRDHLKSNEAGYRIVENVRAAFFILSDSSEAELKAHVILRSWNQEAYGHDWSCWIIQEEIAIEPNQEWIKEIYNHLYND